MALANLKDDKLSSINPSTGESIGDLRASTKADVVAAVARARAAQPAWGALPAEARARVLLRLRDLVVERYDDIAKVDHEETGKSLFEAGMVLLGVADQAGYYAKLAVRLEKGQPAGVGALVGKEAAIYCRPLGVAGVISPWNYPFFLAMLHILPALAAGNAVVHKPSEHSPRVGLLVAELFEAAGLPKGVLEVVIGDGATGQAIIEAGVDIVSFTGAPSTGKKVLAAAAPHLTPVILELGGKDAAIVCDDADLDRAANGVVWGAFINAGQTCVSIKRAIVADRLYDRFVEMVASRASTLGDQVGAITLARELERLERHVATAKAAGARVVAGCARVPGKGTFFAPTVLADCKPDMAAVREETFGPLLTILRAKDDDEALALANDSEFGLGGAVFSRDEARARRIAARLQTGGVSINDVTVHAMNTRIPFGGVKHSGFGRAAGELGYYAYCNVQSVQIAKLQPDREIYWYPYTKGLAAAWRRLVGLYHGSPIQKIRRLITG
jgi:acyl-CoA reductase-like NAD-dependent aldehyde dehydrogenase